MNLKEYLVAQQQNANINEAFLLPLLTAGLFGSVFGSLFGWFSKKKRKEWDDDVEDRIGSRRNDLGGAATLFGGAEEDEDTGAKAVEPIDELSDDKQIDEIVKTQVLMTKMMEGKEGPEVEQAKMLMNQMNACLYDEEGNLRSPEDREKFASEMNSGVEGAFDIYKSSFDKIADDISFTQNSELKDQLDLDKVTAKEIEKQKEENKKAAIQIHKDIAKSREENPDDDAIVAFYKGTGAPKEIVGAIEKSVKIAHEAEKMEEEIAREEEEFAKKKKEIIQKSEAGEIDDDEKEEQLKKAEEEHDKKVKELEDKINKLGAEPDGDEEGNEEGEGKTDPEAKEPKKEDNKTEPESKDDDTFKDEDGNEYREDGDKYYMKDGKGEEIEIEKKDFEEAQKNAVSDDESEDDVKDSKFEDGDPEDDEVDDKGNSKKDPRKVWKKKTYKRGDKSFKTKSYYNKNGDSISAEEFKEKVKNFTKSQKPNESFMDLSGYMKMIFG